MSNLSGVLAPRSVARAIALIACGVAWVACAGQPEEPVSSGEAEPVSSEDVASAQQASLALAPPPGCQEIHLEDLQNGIQLTPVKYSQQPTLRGLFASFGDPAFDDLARVRLDTNTAPGVYSLAGDNSDLYTCKQCAWGIQDSGGPTQKTFVADSGALIVAGKVSPEQSAGALFNVTLREAVGAPPYNAPYGGSTFVEGGECRWIRLATWSTIRPKGCDPRQGSPTAHLPGLTCVADSYAADDGTLERSTGTKQQGELCTSTPGAHANDLAKTDCAPGFACTTAIEDSPTCMRTCDYLSPHPGCTGTTVCGPLGLCAEQAKLESFGFTFEDVAIGATCSSSLVYFCGSEGARGVCVDIDEAGPSPSTCYPYARARSSCPAGQELGYLDYSLADGGYDLTYGWCYTPVATP
jgi:hypothetical protein